MRIKIRKSDKIFSQYIRERDKWICQRCGSKSKSLQNSHFHGRRKESVRFDSANCCALCFSCHQYLDSNPLEHVKWKRAQLGEKRFKALNVRAQMIKKRDDKMDVIVCQALLDSLKKS